MMKKLSNRLLIVILVMLTALFAATRMFRNTAREGNFDKKVLALDTTGIDRITLVRGNETPISLARTNGAWTVSDDNVTSNAEKARVTDLLAALANLTPERFVTRSAEKWENYEVASGNALEVKIFKGEKPLTGLMIGKETAGKTYVRSSDSPEVYAVNGRLRTTAGKDLDAWRDASFLRIERDGIFRITFSYPADSSFVIEKKNNAWMVDDRKADSTAIKQYLNRLRTKDHRQFADTFQPDRKPDVVVTFTGEKNDVVIEAWNTAYYEWVYRSSRHPGVFFLDSKMDLTRDILKGRSAFEEK